MRIRSRVLRPGLLTVAAGVLGLGLASATAAFSVGRSFLVAALPGIGEPQELVSVEFRGQSGRTVGVSHPNLEDLAALSPSLQTITGLRPVTLDFRVGSGAARRVSGEVVAPGYFGFLRAAFVLGRAPDAREESTGANVAVISEALWRQDFGGDREIVGRTVTLNGQTFLVVGVVNGGFRGASRLQPRDVWVPIATYPALRHRPDLAPTEDRSADTYRQVLARVRRGAALPAVAGELRHAADALAGRYPEIADRLGRYPPEVARFDGLFSWQNVVVRRMLRVLAGLALLLVVMCTTNAANVLALRRLSMQRTRELKMALGASESRLLAEDALALTFIAGMTGALALVGAPAIVALLATAAATTARLADPGTGTSLPTVLFGALASVLVVVVAALLARGVDRGGRVPGRLRAWGVGDRRGFRWRRGLIAVQLCVTLALLVPALGLFGSLRRLSQVDLGIEPRHVYSVAIDPEPQGYSDEEARNLHTRLAAALEQDPRVSALAQASGAPFDPPSIRLRIARNDAGDTVPLVVPGRYVGEHYFDVLGIRTLQGSAADLNAGGSAGTIVITRALAQKLGSRAASVGDVVRVLGIPGMDALRIAAIVTDARLEGLRSDPPGEAFLPLGEYYAQDRTFLLQLFGVSGFEVGDIVRGALGQIGPQFPVSGPASLEESAARLMEQEVSLFRLLLAFALISVLLSALGLYAVVAQFVNSTTKETGIRAALGESPNRASWRILRSVAGLVVLSLPPGLWAAWALSEALSSWFYEFGPGDSTLYLAGSFAVLTAALISSATPVFRARRTSPLEAIRSGPGSGRL